MISGISQKSTHDFWAKRKIKSWFLWEPKNQIMNTERSEKSNHENHDLSVIRNLDANKISANPYKNDLLMIISD